jgi:hypothetical protein
MGTTLRESDAAPRFLKLSSGASVHDIADRCREAVLDFVAGAASGWSRVDLELWLAAPYRGATTVFGRPKGEPRTVWTSASPCSSVVVEACLLQTAERLREMIASCAEGRQPAFVEEAVLSGFVAGITDENGACGYAPADVGDMNLIDRVASLLAADFLTRRNDYGTVAICEHCGAVSFAWTSCCHEVCAAPYESGPYESAIVRRDGAPASYPAIFPPSGR